MRSYRISLLATLSLLLLTIAAVTPRAEPGGVRMYNTAKVKLMNGESIVGGTVSTPDPEIYCAMAHAGYDFIWIEMQHSPLTFRESARMIWACRDAPAIPFIRVPDATEGAIQKATDIGALGIIVPMVSTAEKMREATKYAFYPPLGERSQGGGQYRALWGGDYRQTINDNLLLVAMVETVVGVEAVDEIAAVPHVYVVFAASRGGVHPIKPATLGLEGPRSIGYTKTAIYGGLFRGRISLNLPEFVRCGRFWAPG